MCHQAGQRESSGLSEKALKKHARVIKQRSRLSDSAATHLARIDRLSASLSGALTP